jgi:hypothetical protein
MSERTDHADQVDPVDETGGGAAPEDTATGMMATPVTHMDHEMLPPNAPSRVVGGEDDTGLHRDDPIEMETVLVPEAQEASEHHTVQLGNAKGSADTAREVPAGSSQGTASGATDQGEGARIPLASRMRYEAKWVGGLGVLLAVPVALIGLRAQRRRSRQRDGAKLGSNQRFSVATWSQLGSAARQAAGRIQGRPDVTASQSRTKAGVLANQAQKWVGRLRGRGREKTRQQVIRSRAQQAVGEVTQLVQSHGATLCAAVGSTGLVTAGWLVDKRRVRRMK